MVCILSPTYLYQWPLALPRGQSCSSHSSFHPRDSNACLLSPIPPLRNSSVWCQLTKRGLHWLVWTHGDFSQRRVAIFQVDFEHWKRSGKMEPEDKFVNLSLISIPLSLHLPRVILKHKSFILPQWWYLSRNEQLSCICYGIWPSQ